MTNSVQNPDGSWSPAEPIGPQGWKARLEFWLRARKRMPRLVAFLTRWDERGLG